MPFAFIKFELIFCSLFVTKPLRRIISAVTFPAVANLFFFEVFTLGSFFGKDIDDSLLPTFFKLLLSVNFAFNNVITFIHFSFSCGVLTRKTKSLPSKRKLNSRGDSDCGMEIWSNINKPFISISSGFSA